MNVVIQSKLLKGLLTSLINKKIKKEIDDSLEVNIEKMKIECGDDETNIIITIHAKADTRKIPALLKKYDIL